MPKERRDQQADAAAATPRRPRLRERARAILPRPVPHRLSRPLAAAVLLSWPLTMGLVVRRAYFERPLPLAADLARYGQAAQWKGIYYRGEKIGFSVSQVEPAAGGFLMREDARLSMNLLGVTTAVALQTRVVVDQAFALRRFSFSLDPGHGATTIEGTLAGRRLDLTLKTATGVRNESRELDEAPSLALNLPRRLAAAGLQAGLRRSFSVFDPTTLRNAPLEVEVAGRELVPGLDRPLPAFRIKTRFIGIESQSWITDGGDVVREESPLGLITIRESAERARGQAVPGSMRLDMLEAAAVVPGPPNARIDDPALVTRLRLRLTGVEAFAGPQLQGAGQSVDGDIFELVDPRSLRPTPLLEPLAAFLRPEPFIESDAEEIVAEARRAIGAIGDVGAIGGDRQRAERLVRYVHALVEKRPTVSLPSALEVLRTRIGDCNEHTVLYVAMARATGLPARTAVGLVCLRGAFYYHAWPEVFVREGPGGLWLPVDPTLNQFPADATHVRLTRGGLDAQAAIVTVIGRARMTILDLETEPGATPILVGRANEDSRPLELALPVPDARRSCWNKPVR